MLLEFEYSPTSLFSLRSSSSTSSAGKTLFCPSPYAVKMALLNAIITYNSLEIAKENFEMIRDLEMQFKLPHKFVVNNCMIRILKDNDKVSKDVKEFAPFKSTVAFREYVYFNGNIKIAINLNSLENDQVKFLKKWFIHINYFGKKGCFFQFINFIKTLGPGNEYSVLLNEKFTNLSPGIIVEMDDFGENATFDNVNTYSSAKTKRKRKFYVLPVKMERANKNFTLFSRL
jgi:hypothetical protein